MAVPTWSAADLFNLSLEGPRFCDRTAACATAHCCNCDGAYAVKAVARLPHSKLGPRVTLHFAIDVLHVGFDRHVGAELLNAKV
jgi:hypothetical protein